MYTQSELNDIIQHAIEHFAYPQVAQELYTPIQYTLEAGGKRIRPTLTLMAANLFTDHIEPAIAPALGIEMYHNFTLLHDDVMDNAPDRRGRPTVHIKWNRNAAILSGDAMQGLAYQLIAQTPVPALKAVLDLFNQTNLEICEGQQFDIEFETRQHVTIEEYIEMIRLKTSVLLGCALKTGAIIGMQETATENTFYPEDADALYEFGVNIGLAFQLQDDWLDCWGDPATFGKRIGGDILCNKKTFLLITALKNASEADRAIMERELSPSTATMTETDKISFFTDLYRHCGAEQACIDTMNEYHELAMQALDRLHVDHSKLGLLRSFADKLKTRNI